MAEESGVAADEAEAVEFERNTSLNIWLRIHAVMLEVDGHIEKDGTHETSYKQKDGTKRAGKPFAYVSHDIVAARIRPALLRHGVLPHTSLESHNINGNRVECVYLVRFVNIDEPSDSIDERVLSFGADYSDKGPGKALTYALKNALLKRFLFNSADDIEADDVEHETESAALKLVDAQAKINQLDATAANNLYAALKGARSIEAIDGLMETPENKKLLRGLPDVTREHFTKTAESLKRQMEEE